MRRVVKREGRQRRANQLKCALEAVLRALEVAFLPQAGAQRVPRGNGAGVELDRRRQMLLRALVVLVQHVQRPSAKGCEFSRRCVCVACGRSRDGMARVSAEDIGPRRDSGVAPRSESIAARARSLRSLSSVWAALPAAGGQRREAAGRSKSS